MVAMLPWLRDSGMALRMVLWVGRGKWQGGLGTSTVVLPYTLTAL
jgi:hypothetical protein